jgi:hypothetical protein
MRSVISWQIGILWFINMVKLLVHHGPNFNSNIAVLFFLQYVEKRKMN